MFGGIYINSTTAHYKFYAKAATKVNVFGETINVVDAEISSHTYGRYLYYKLYLKKGISVVKDINEKKDIGVVKDIAELKDQGVVENSTNKLKNTTVSINNTNFKNLKTCNQMPLELYNVEETREIFHKKMTYVYMCMFQHYISTSKEN